MEWSARRDTKWRGNLYSNNWPFPKLSIFSVLEVKTVFFISVLQINENPPKKRKTSQTRRSPISLVRSREHDQIVLLHISCWINHILNPNLFRILIFSSGKEFIFFQLNRFSHNEFLKILILRDDRMYCVCRYVRAGGYCGRPAAGVS